LFFLHVGGASIPKKENKIAKERNQRKEKKRKK